MENKTPIGEIDTYQPVFLPSRHIIRSLKAQGDRQRSISEKIADWLTANFGSITFFIINLLWFSIWIVINTSLIPGIAPFDPFPFGLLTTIVSLEAIILAIFVLMSQNRAQKIDDLREEKDLQVDIITEQELTKMMELLVMLMKKNGIDVSKDKKLMQMLKPIDTEKIEKSLEKQVT